MMDYGVPSNGIRKIAINIQDLNQKVRYLRRESFEMALRAGKAHLGGSFSCAEILTALYYGGILRFDPKNPLWKERDRFILSKGHSVNVLHVILADIGFFQKEEILHYLEDGSHLSGHVDTITPGIDIIGGSLGHGLGVAGGMALGFKIDKQPSRVYVILGDGECQEGSTWEAVLFASHHHLDNMTVLLDRNGLGSEDFTENTCRLEPLQEKWKSFGWDTATIDGHNIGLIVDTLNNHVPSGRPFVVICKTVKGKGMSWCENKPASHHTLPTGSYIESTRKELLNG